jgi:hypothetical protein
MLISCFCRGFVKTTKTYLPTDRNIISTEKMSKYICFIKLKHLIFINTEGLVLFNC